MRYISKNEDYLIKLWSQYVRYLPFVASRNRIKGFEFEKDVGWGKVIIKGNETFNAYDLVTLLTITKIAQENTAKLTDAGHILDREVVGLENVIGYRVLGMARRGAGSKQYKLLENSFERIISTTWGFESSKKKERIFGIKILLAYKRIEENVSGKKERIYNFYLNKKWIDSNEASGLLINYTKIVSVNSDFVKALIFFLESQRKSRQCFSEEYLIKILGLDAVYGRIQDIRRKLVNAFNKLVEIGYLKNWGVNGKPEIRSDKSRWYPYRYAHSYKGVKKAIQEGE